MTKEFLENQIKEIEELIQYSKDMMDNEAVEEMEQDLEDLRADLEALN